MADKPIVRCSSLADMLGCYAKPQMLAKTGGFDGDVSQGLWCHHDAALKLAEAGATGTVEWPRELEKGYEPADPFAKWISDMFVNEVLYHVPQDWAIEVEGGFSMEFDRFILSGHIDVAALQFDSRDFDRAELVSAWVWDQKSGRVPVESAETNPQVAGYLTLMHDAYPAIRSAKGSICQPLNDEESGFPRVTTRTVEDLPALRDDLERRINHALDHSNLLITGWKQCQYCSAALICPAFIDDMKMELTPELMAEIDGTPDVERLATIDLMRRKFAGAMDKAHSALKDQLPLGEPMEFEGATFCVKEQNGPRYITDNEAASAAISDLPDEMYFNCMKLKVGEIERSLAEHLNLKKKSKREHDARDEFDKRLGAVTKQPRVKRLLVG